MWAPSSTLVPHPRAEITKGPVRGPGEVREKAAIGIMQRRSREVSREEVGGPERGEGRLERAPCDPAKETITVRTSQKKS